MWYCLHDSSIQFFWYVCSIVAFIEYFQSNSFSFGSFFVCVFFFWIVVFNFWHFIYFWDWIFAKWQITGVVYILVMHLGHRIARNEGVMYSEHNRPPNSIRILFQLLQNVQYSSKLLNCVRLFSSARVSNCGGTKNKQAHIWLNKTSRLWIILMAWSHIVIDCIQWKSYRTTN